MKRWQYEPATDLDQTLVERLRNFPREPDMLVYGLRSLVALIIRALAAHLSSLRDHRTKSICAAIARSCWWRIIPAISTRVCLLAALAASPDLHRAFPGRGGRLFFQERAAHLDRDRHRECAAFRASDACPAKSCRFVVRAARECRKHSDHFSGGNPLRAPARSQEFKAGIGALVAGRDVAVLPCYLDGAFRAWPKGSIWPRPRKVRLIIGAPRNYASRS